ncbi:MAG: acyl-CoA dehydrogenase, partial [Proteobacteria bacterium]|nr:acyl-CoA dehydrogenase [Pseudomonadota bacterium]
MSTTQSDLFELAMSEEAQPLMAAVQNHITTHVEPITEEFYALDAEKTD